MVPGGVSQVEEGSHIGGGRPAARWKAPSRWLVRMRVSSPGQTGPPHADRCL